MKTTNLPAIVSAFALVAGLLMPEQVSTRVLLYGIGLSILALAWEVRNAWELRA